MNNGWVMTHEQARAALNLAPMDSEPSRVRPGYTRREMVALCNSALLGLNPTAINVPPSFAQVVAQVVQDWPDPVEMRFCYDPMGIIQVGWNHEELEMRKGLRPRPALTDDGLAGYAYRTDLEAYLQKERSAINQQLANFQPTPEQQAIMAQRQQGIAPFLARLDAELARTQALAAGPTITISQRDLQLLQEMGVVNGKSNTSPKPAPPPPAPAPEPEAKPDPTSPKFVLKRPKIG